MLPTNSRQVNRNTNVTLERPMRNLYKKSPPHPWRGALVAAVILVAAWVGYALWSPGLEVSDGRYDLGRNAIWLGHGWLGADEWFARYGKEDTVEQFRVPEKMQELARRLKEHHISDVFPHVAPSDLNGRVPEVDHRQTERFLDAFDGFRVLPWVGGVLGKQVRLEDVRWRKTFVHSAVELLNRHPRFAGIHVNIEPCPMGNQNFLTLLTELRHALPEGKLLSVAAFPPPTRLHPFSSLYWDEAYYRAVTHHADQLAVMMYDTALPVAKVYRALMASWTREVLEWSEGSAVLLGVPTYDDAGVGYHDPRVENLRHALAGIHAGLAGIEVPPASYQGIALYAEWEMDQGEWQYWSDFFMSPRQKQVTDR